LRNASVQLTISNGRINSLVDVKLKCVFQINFLALKMLILTSPSSRELIAEGHTGGLVIFQDRPNYWDAWGIVVITYVVESTANFWI
jgi:alpha-mannosidase